MFLSTAALAQTADVDPEPIYRFAQGCDAEDEIRSVYEAALQGEAIDTQSLLTDLIERVVQPVEETLQRAAALLPDVLLLMLAQATMPERRGAGAGVRFLLRLRLALGFSGLAEIALTEAGKCLASAKAFTDAASPVIAALLTAMGMNASAALVSPAAALAGGMAERLFARYGLPLCRMALCLAIAGSLSRAINLSRITLLMRKLANWGAGLATTLLTALVALQGNVSGAFDSVSVRTAKFAVDSAVPVIGSGVSDAWESYISGMMIAKNALGVSGVAALVAAGLRPVICCASAMLVLHLTAALLEIFGDSETAGSALQISGICQMALSLATGALVIATVLLGAVMAAGRMLFS